MAAEFSALLNWEGCDAWREYAPDFRYHLHDLSQLADEELKGELFARLGTLALKHIFDKKLDELWRQIIMLLQREPEPHALDYLMVILRYITQAREQASAAEIKRLLTAAFPKEAEASMETLAQMWTREGLEQGLQQGLQQGRLDALRDLVLRQLQWRFGQFDEETMARILSLTDAQLENLGDSLLDFTVRTDLDDWLNQQA
ncbi:MAG: DUF4351 domain-containing protein [Acidobacteriota bacterium]